MKKFIVLTLALAVLCTSLFATRIGITYKDVDYVLNTSVTVSADDTAYFAGMYDALVCVKEGRQLYEIEQVIAQKTFLQQDGKSVDLEQKKTYKTAFYDFMEHYTEGSIGAFSDIFPLYESLMNETQSYRNARLIVEFGQARFYPRNL